MMHEEVLLFNQNHRFDKKDIPLCQQGHYSRTKSVIGDDVRIGARAIILPIVKKLAVGVIIGVDSVVTKDIDAFCIVAGNPAKVIKWTK